MAITVGLLFIVGVVVRLILLQTDLPQWVANKNEVITPLTAWERVQEGLALKKNMISPYDGDIFHETPILLKIMEIVNNFPTGSKYFFVILDLWMGLLLLSITNKFAVYKLKQQAEGVKKYSVDVEKIILRSKDLRHLGSYVIAVHFLNPYTISTCLARSTASVSNLAVIYIFYYMLHNKLILCTFFIAVATYQSFYPFILVAPVALYFYIHQTSPKSVTSYNSSGAIFSYTRTCLLSIGWLMVLLGLSCVMEGSWSFLYSTYGFILTVPDLSPNVGVFWYFFTEMFEHFRVFFICVFQINAVVYTVPLAVKLRKNPVFFLYMLIFLTSIFKSYPSYSDVGLCLTLLPLWKHTFSYMRNSFVVACMYICCTVFAPVLWHLWIYAGSANANFYFAITLVFSTAQIFLVTDLLFAFLRREYDLYNGTTHKLENGETTQIILE
ncbi:phosphatidylinositol glycan anchor biosynthesis class U protein [Patella vulgata]|uniref:phosphatidylinositol glycan anchor biosynthesis class U protein n=1 Tax=Patella vulgata TaxID=6465 RepID=UPI00217F6EDD|nr:phosphatidylinositol glycan anchor biosynthesis class U protein [Patella vulgata]